MITFYDELAKVIEPHGVAADRLNKDLVKLLCELYNRGFRAGVKFRGDPADAAFAEDLLAKMNSFCARVEKEKRAIEE